MSEYQMNYDDFSNDMFLQSLEAMYPDIYYDVYPLVEDLVSEMMERSGGNAVVTDEILQGMIQNVLADSGMDSTAAQEEAIPVQRGFGRGHYGHRRYDRNSLQDIIRILLLRELFDKNCRGRNCHRPYGQYPYLYD